MKREIDSILKAGGYFLAFFLEFLPFPRECLYYLAFPGVWLRALICYNMMMYDCYNVVTLCILFGYVSCNKRVTRACECIATPTAGSRSTVDNSYVTKIYY